MTELGGRKGDPARAALIAAAANQASALWAAHRGLS
jgi:hypothetical protein